MNEMVHFLSAIEWALVSWKVICDEAWDMDLKIIAPQKALLVVGCSMQNCVWWLRTRLSWQKPIQTQGALAELEDNCFMNREH